MMLLLAITIFGALLSLLYGWALEFFATRALRLDEPPQPHFAVSILSGLSLLSSLLGIWSAYWGVATRALAFFSALVLVLVILIRKYVWARVQTMYVQLRSMGARPMLLCALLFTYALYLAAAANPTADTGLYHAQSIRWIETFHVVPGLANLHARLGFNSTIFLLAAFWGFAGLGWHAYQIPGLVIFLSAILYLSDQMSKSGKSFSLAGLIGFGVLAYLLLEQHLMLWLASPTTDLPAAVLVWVLFVLAVEKIESGGLRELDLQAVSIVLLSLFALSIKLSTLPILVLPFFFLWETRTSLHIKSGLVLGSTAAFLLLPWVVRNIILTGYIAFPFDQPDIFSFDWKVPSATARGLAGDITSWGRIPYEETRIVMALKFYQWLPRWVQSLSNLDILIVLALLAYPVVRIVIHFLTRKPKAVQIPKYGVVQIAAAVGVIFWFVESPAPRFGYGFLVGLLLLSYAPLASGLLSGLGLAQKWAVILAQGLLILGLLGLMFQLPLSSWKHYLNYYKSYPVIATTAIDLDGRPLFLPVNGGQCWYTAFPCTPPASLSPGLEMRGPSLGDGFRVVQK